MIRIPALILASALAIGSAGTAFSQSGGGTAGNTTTKAQRAGDDKLLGLLGLAGLMGRNRNNTLR